MAQSQKDLVESFVNGATHGQASNMEIREGPITHAGNTYVHEGETALIGYGWAIYAKLKNIYAKRTSGGRVIVYNGWREWANSKDGHSGHTTLQHLSLIESAADPTFMYSHQQAQASSAPDSANTMRQLDR